MRAKLILLLLILIGGGFYLTQRLSRTEYLGGVSTSEKKSNFTVFNTSTINNKLVPDTDLGADLGTPDLRFGNGYFGTSTIDNLVINVRFASGTIQTVDGTSSTPGFAFSSQPSLGIYRPSSGNIGFTGHLLPYASNLLDLGSLSNSWRNVYTSGTAYLGGGPVTSDIYKVQVNAGASTYGLGIKVTSPAVTASLSFPAIDIIDTSNREFGGSFSTTDNAWNMGTLSSAKFNLFTGATARVTLDNSGNFTPFVTNGTNMGTDSLSWGNVTASGTAKFGTGGSAGKAICWKADGKTLGYCSSVIGVGGDCTCN